MPAELLRQFMRLAGMAGRTWAPGGVDAWQHVFAQLWMAVEAAAGQDHAAPNLHGAPLAFVHQRDRLDAARALVDVLDRRVHGQRDILSKRQRIQQPADQRIAHYQPRAARMAQPVAGMPGQQLEGVLEGGQRLAQRQQMVDVGAVHHHAAEHGEFRNRRADQPEQIAQQPAIKRQRLERAAVDGRAFQIGNVVRVPGISAVLDLGIGFDLIDRAWAVVEKSLAQRGRRALAHGVVEVALGVLQRVGRIHRCTVARARYPGRSA